MLSWGEADNAIDIGRKVSDLLKLMEHFVGKFCWRYRTGKLFSNETPILSNMLRFHGQVVGVCCWWWLRWFKLYRFWWVALKSQKSYTVTDLGSWFPTWLALILSGLKPPRSCGTNRDKHPQVIHDLFHFLALGIQYAWYTRYIASWF